MSLRKNTWIPNAATIVVVAAVLLLIPWLGLTLFNSKGEPREAIVAVSILQSGDWILPVNYGDDIPFKPPFLAWCIAVFAKIFNGGTVNEFLSRLPSALAALGMIMAGYKWAEKARGVRFAMIFSFVTLTSVEVFRAAVACRLDMVLTACMVTALYMLYTLAESKVRRRGLWYAGVVILLTCATLTKGPVGALLPCLIAGIYMLLRGKRFFPTFFTLLVIALLSMVLPAWWAVEAYSRGGDHFYELMMEENIGRLTGTMSYDSHIKPWWYNFLTLAAGLLPWTLLLLAACFGRRRNYATCKVSPAALFSIVAAVVTVLFYTIPASKRSVYLLPAYPFICYGIAHIIDNTDRRTAIRFFTWFMAVLAIIVPPAVIWLSISPLPSLPMDSIPWWGYAIIIIPLLPAVSWCVNRHSPAAHAFAIVWSLYLVYAAAVMPTVLNPKSDYRLIPAIGAASDTEILSIAPDKAYRFFTINYYMDNRLRLAKDIDDAATHPAGTILLVPAECDTTGLGKYFDYRPLTARSCDFRHAAGIAIKR